MRCRMRVLRMWMQVAVGGVILLVVGRVVVVGQLLVNMLLLLLLLVLLVVGMARWKHLEMVLLQLGLGETPTLVLTFQGSSSEGWLLVFLVT